MSNLERTDWRQTPEEQAKSAGVIKTLEAAIVAAPKKSPEYSGKERRTDKDGNKVVSPTRRETLARCLVNLNQALANLEATGTLDDSARVMIVEGLDANIVLTMDGYFDEKGTVQVGSRCIAQIQSLSGKPEVTRQSAAPEVAGDSDEEEL